MCKDLSLKNRLVEIMDGILLEKPQLYTVASKFWNVELLVFPSKSTNIYENIYDLFNLKVGLWRTIVSR